MLTHLDNLEEDDIPWDLIPPFPALTHIAFPTHVHLDISPGEIKRIMRLILADYAKIRTVVISYDADGRDRSTPYTPQNAGVEEFPRMAFVAYKPENSVREAASRGELDMWSLAEDYLATRNRLGASLSSVPNLELT